MRRGFVVYGALAVIGVGSGTAAAHEVAFKSPGPGMHFTEGQPIIVFADLFDSNNGHGAVIDGVGWPKLQLLVDGVVQTDRATGGEIVEGTSALDGNGNPDPIDFYRFSVEGVPAGTHELVVRGLFPPEPDSDGATQDSAPLRVVVDAVPADKELISLTSDISGPVDWQNVMVIGNGHTISPSGSVVIENSLITGLGSLDRPGISGEASSLRIEGSVFEATGAIALTISGDASVRNNEFRANNLIQFVPANPDASPVILLQGTSAAPKLFQGNRVGAGRVVFDRSSNWLVGGDRDEDSNILIGPRCTLYFVNGSSNITVRGNYDHHNYRGGWSQGFNLSFMCQYCGAASGDEVLAEHNFIRGGSWPIQSLVGEFRYNVVYGYGHEWLRSATAGASIHHNLFLPEGRGGLNDGMLFYGDETGLQIYNNTFDGGGTTGDFSGPMIAATGASRVESLRNNLFTFSRDPDNGAGPPGVTGDDGSVAYCDFNAFYSPDNSTSDNYDIAGMTEGTTSNFAGHDVSGAGVVGAVDGQLGAAPFAGERIYPLIDGDVVDEAALWQGTQRLSTVLAAFRARYTPRAGSPIIDAGDPADDDERGRRTDIGAIDRNGHALDQLGRFGDPSLAPEPPAAGAGGSAATPADGGSGTAGSQAGRGGSRPDTSASGPTTAAGDDAGSDSTDGAADPSRRGVSGGCGCTVTGAPARPTAWLLASLALFRWKRRRRGIR